MFRKHLIFLPVVISVVLSAGCSSTAAQQACPAVAGKLSNLDIKNLPADAVPYLARYSLPTTDRTAFCAYLERIQHEHEVKVEGGLLDMMGDYFLTTQKIETGYYFSYKIGSPGREIPKVILDRASSESEQADLFLKAIDSDPDASRKEVFNDRIKELSPENRKDGALKLIQLLFKKSWVFDPTAQQYLGSENYHDDSYGFVDRGLRTTSYSHMGTTLDLLFNGSDLDSVKKLLPEKAKRVLIIGPGLDFSHPELGEEIPQQSYEPFAILDILLKSKRSDFTNLQIDLFDISPRVVRHWDGLLQSADRGNTYTLNVVSGAAMLRGGNQESSEITTAYVNQFGDSLPGVTSTVSTKTSRRPVPRTLDSYSVSVRSLNIAPAVVKKFHPFQGDLTTTDIAKIAVENGGKYDLIFCFNTMEYLNESERALAGINIREALANNGAFITDNRFETDSGERPQQPKQNTSAVKPIFDPSFLNMAADAITATGRHVIVYRKPNAG